MEKRSILKIYGKVQGVGFRYWTVVKARRLRLKGYVKNLEDGSVYVEVEGEEKVLIDFLNWIKEGGPTGSEISKIEERKEKGLKQFETFSIEQ